MKAFEISAEQIARIIGGLVADELSWRFKRHTDFLTLASWTAETPLGAGGLTLSPEEKAQCARRCARFFGVGEALLADAPAATIADWAQAIEKAIRRSLTAFTFAAAGRDSETEATTHPADEIFNDAAAAANLLYGRRRLISLIAPHGLLSFAVTVLTPNLQHIPSIDARGMTPDALAGALAFGDVVVATPSLWRYMISEGVSAPDNAMGVCFGEAMTPELAADLRKAGFGALRELYGSTESGLIAWRDSPSEPFVLFDHWRRKDAGLVRISPSGAARDIAPMDALDWVSDFSFRLGARRDGAVQIGAVNVFPDRIAEIICAHPAVGACKVRVARHAGGVIRLIAHIELKQGNAPTEQTARGIDAWCRSELRPQERPRIYNFEASLEE